MKIFTHLFKKTQILLWEKFEKHKEEQRIRFIATLVHDLKNPVIAQIRAIECMLRNEFGELTPKQKEMLEIILESCKYMNNILVSVLEIYRNRNGVTELNYKTNNLQKLVKDCVEETSCIAIERNLRFTLNIDESIEKVLCDNAQIRRVVMNLLSNQVKYAFKNSTIVVNISQKEGYVYVCFENHSPYIPQEIMETIFDRYVTYAKNYNQTGMGIGLYSSKKIIEAHDGEIFAQSFKEERNIFGFRIPLKSTNKKKRREVCF